MIPRQKWKAKTAFDCARWKVEPKWYRGLQLRPFRPVLNRQTAKAVLLSSFHNRIPFVGLSSAWVKAGALYALNWDYSDIGAQSGEIALRVLQGTPPGTIPPVPPRKVQYALNLKTASHMKLDLTPQLIDAALETFK